MDDTSSSYRLGATRNRPSSNCISLFSSKLFKTGSTFRSVFSIPSRIKTRPLTTLLHPDSQANISAVPDESWLDPQYPIRKVTERIITCSEQAAQSTSVGYFSFSAKATDGTTVHASVPARVIPSMPRPIIGTDSQQHHVNFDPYGNRMVIQGKSVPLQFDGLYKFAADLTPSASPEPLC